MKNALLNISVLYDRKHEPLSIIGEFRDRDLERKYIECEVRDSVKFIKLTMLLLAFLYLLFIIPDILLLKNAGTLILISINRIAFSALVLFFYFKVERMKPGLRIYNWVMAYELLGAALLLLVCFQYESPNFFLLSFGVIVFVLAFFLVPGRWINTVAAASFLGISFLVISKFYFKGLMLREYQAAALYISLSVILTSISSSRIQYYKRNQFLYSIELDRLSVTDPLTQIYNRHKFDIELSRNISLAKRYNMSLSLLLFDIDDFKKVNDMYGHLAGDRVLSSIAEIVKNSIRENDVFARWGGEEFVILLPGTDSTMAVELAERLKKKISQFSFEGMDRITCSFGTVSLRDNDDVDSIMQRVDELLYEAKTSGKDCVMS